MNRRWGDHPGDDPPPTKEQFAHEWDEMRYLYQCASYWFRRRKNLHRATYCLIRLQELIVPVEHTLVVTDHADALILVASKALLSEWTGDQVGEVAALERLVVLIPKLLAEWPECPDTSLGDLKQEQSALKRARSK